MLLDVIRFFRWTVADSQKEGSGAALIAMIFFLDHS
jgi:hypothetical protein